MAEFAAGKFSIRANSLLFECVVLHGGYFYMGGKGEKLKLPPLESFRREIQIGLGKNGGKISFSLRNCC